MYDKTRPLTDGPYKEGNGQATRWSAAIRDTLQWRSNTIHSPIGVPWGVGSMPRIHARHVPLPSTLAARGRMTLQLLQHAPVDRPGRVSTITPRACEVPY